MNSVPINPAIYGGGKKSAKNLGLQPLKSKWQLKPKELWSYSFCLERLG